jgi:predicted secreted Zn-dependent protease
MRVSQNNLTWRKSTRSGAAGHCVEIAEVPTEVLVRDSKDASGPVLRFAARGWEGFLAGVRDGEFDRPTA